MGDWSSLPYDILGLVAERLTFLPDLVRFSCVCLQWLVVAKTNYKTLSYRSPLLMLPYDEGTRTCNFLNLHEEVSNGTKLPELHNKWVCGSSNGWLITIDDNLEIKLLNPFSRAQILVPHHPLVHILFELGWSAENVDHHALKSSYVNKAILSASPTLCSDFVIAAIVGVKSELAIYRAGDNEWTPVKTEYKHLTDITFYDGKIYAIGDFQPLVICDISHNPKITAINFAHDIRAGKQWYVVESSGELLLVARYRYYDDKADVTKGDHFYKTVNFHVYRLNKTTEDWTKIESLGKRSLFLGGNSSISISASVFPGCRSNCIYFTDDYFEAHCTCECQVDIGVFSLEDGTVAPLSNDLPILRMPAFWYLQGL